MDKAVAEYLTEWSERMTTDLARFELTLRASVTKGEISADEAARFLTLHGYTFEVALLRVSS